MTSRLTFLIGTLSAALVPAAFGQSTASPSAGESRAQVKAETLDAVRTGDLVSGEEGRKLNELYPDRYPKTPAQPGKTRAQVKGDLAKASRNGELPEGDLDETPRDRNPRRYPAQPSPPGLSRAQVKAETQAAVRAGEVQVGESGRTLAEEDPPRYKGAPAKAPKLSLRRHSKTASTTPSSPAGQN